MKKLTDKIYCKIVKSNLYIDYFYSVYKIRHYRLHKILKFVSWVYLAILYIKYRLLGFDAKNKRIYPESKAGVYPNFQKTVSRLSKAHVLSFNVFDTLLLGKAERGEDLFHFIGYTLGVNDYKNIRTEAEREACRNGHADLHSICSVLEERYGIDAARAYAEELKAERSFCYANPYFLRLLSCEELKDKKIIAVCDTCYPSEFIRELLENAGYRIDDIFVSCEYGCSKQDGGLWKIVEPKFGRKGFIHIGSDYKGDIKNCTKAGLHAVGMPSLALACCLYRDYEPRSIVRSLYSALVCAKIHCCGIKYDPFYEHGYLYGGLLVYGFCSWLDRLAKYRGFDRLLFLSRDTEVFYNVYRKYFNNTSSEYLYTSRIAALKLVLPKYFNLFTDIMFERKITNKITVGQALEQAELSELCAALPSWGLSSDTRLDKSVIETVKEFLYDNEREIVAIYRKDKDAFKSYAAPMLAGVKRACIIDLGWCGTTYTALEAFFREEFPNTTFRCAMLGVTDSDMTGYLLDSGKMDSYVFSYKMNSDRMIDISQIMLLETMFSSETPSVTGYAISKDGAAEPIFGKAEEPGSTVFRRMRSGICDFCDEFTQVVRDLPFEPQISGAEAYAPSAEMLPNIRYNLGLFGKLKANDDPNSEPIDMSRLLDEVGYTAYRKK